MTDGWRTIESAPKGDDFVRILATGYDGDYRVVDIIVWGFSWASREVEVGAGLYRKERYRKDECWRRYGDYGEIPIRWEPTHWMPLPNPPGGYPMTDGGGMIEREHERKSTL